MKLFIKVKTNSKKISVDKIDGQHYIVRVTASPVDGKANEAVIRVLAEFFDIAPSTITIVKGLAAREKIVTIA